MTVTDELRQELDPQSAEQTGEDDSHLIHSEELVGAALYSFIKDHKDGITFPLGACESVNDMDCVDSILGRLGSVLRYDVSCMISPTFDVMPGGTRAYEATIYIGE